MCHERVLIGCKPFFWYTGEMADADISGPAPQPNPAANPEREADIARAAEVGRKRAENERELQQRIKADRDAEEKKAKQSVDTAVATKREGQVQKKQFRTMMKTREQEVAEDKKRRAAQEKLVTDAQKARDDHRKVQQGYMKELHETSLLKQAKQRRQKELMAEKERERRKAENDHRAKVASAQHADDARKEALEHEAQARKTLIDTEAKAHEYQLEQGRRSRMAQLENESMRQLASAVTGHSPLQAQQIHGMVEAQLRVKRKKAENEWIEKKAAILQDAVRHKADIDHDFYGKKSQSESELHRMTRLYDGELARKYEEIELKYKELLLANKAS